MMGFFLFGGPRVELDGVALHLGFKPQQLLASLMLFANRPVAADVLVDQLWREELPVNPLNSLQDVVKRLRIVLGDTRREVVVTLGRDYSLVVDPHSLDLTVFRLLASAGMVLEKAEPSLGRIFLARALEVARGDLPDAEPGSRVDDEVQHLERLRAQAVQAANRPLGDHAGVGAIAVDGQATALALRLADLEDLDLAELVCDVARSHGRVDRLGDGLLVATFRGSAAALRSAAELIGSLKSSNGLLGGSVGRLLAGTTDKCLGELIGLAGRAAAGQILVSAPVKKASETSGAAALLRPAGEVWQLANGEISQVVPESAGEALLVGREETVREIVELVGSHRLVTLRGPGGIGKTRIAWEVRRRLIDRFKDGVCFVDLGEADLHGGPLSLVVRSLGLLPEPYRDPEQSLVDLLGSSQRLLILDNCERFSEQMRSLCDALNTACPAICILATSRSALGASRELIREIVELDLADAAELLVALAYSRSPDPSDPFNPTILRLCQQLDRVPLAIECAAAMVRAMGLEGAVDALGSLPDGAVLPLLDAAHGGLGRHRSIELALGASYRALREEDALLHERISSLRGGFRTEDALGMLEDADPREVGAGLVRLREASLVKEVGPGRWRMLEPVRQFGATRLLRRGDQAVQAARHARHFIALSCEAEEGLRGPDEKMWFARLSEAYANLDKALSWTISSGDATAALRLTSSLWWYWAAQGMFVEGARAVERSLALENQVPPALRAKTLVATSHLCWWAGNPRRTESSLIEAMELIDGLEVLDPETIALKACAHTGLAGARFWGGGQYEVLQAHLEEGRRLFSANGDLPGLGLNLSTHSGVAWHYGYDELHLAKAQESLEVFGQAGHQTMIAHMKRVVGLASGQLGRVDEGRSLIEEGLAMSRELGDPGGEPLGLALLGILETWAGKRDAADAAFARSVASNRLLGQMWPSLLAIDFGSERAVHKSRPGDAVRMRAAAGALTSRTGIRLAPRDRRRVARAVHAADGQFDPDDLAKLRNEGSALPTPKAMALALETFEE
ncbi:MAG: AfsR/SARP family transcriptional regulator [Actinomycetota bacterium]